MVLDPHRTRQAFGVKLIEFLTDPRVYCEAIASVRPGENPIRSILDDQMAKMKDGLITGFQLIRDSKQSSVKLLANLEELRRTCVSLHGSKSDKVRDIDAKIKRVRRGAKDAFAAMALPLGLERFAYFRTYANGIYRVDRKPSASEAIDLLHLSYHADVDLIRMDRRMAELVKDDCALQEKIVPRLSQLPHAIRAVVERRQALLAQ